jgi:hypothetical protein
MLFVVDLSVFENRFTTHFNGLLDLKRSDNDNKNSKGSWWCASKSRLQEAFLAASNSSSASA